MLDWFKAKGWALFRTFVAILAPFLIQWLGDRTSVDWRVAGSMIGMTVVLFVVSSLKEIPTPGSAPAWQILLWRFLRQFGQVIGASIGTAILLTDVAWGPLLITAAVSAFSSVVLGSFSVQPGSELASLEPIAFTVYNTPETEVTGSSVLSFPSEEADYAPERALLE